MTSANVPCHPEPSDQYEQTPQPHHQWHRPDPEGPDDSDNHSDEFSEESAYCAQDDKHFWSEEIGFFSPHLDVKNYGPSDIIDISEKTYFQDVHLFIDSFKDVAHTKANEVVRRNLNKCLWGVAQDWYIGQLLLMEQDHIQEENRVEQWEERLFKQFKCTQSSALRALETEWYTIQNVQSNRETSVFILNVVWYTKDAGMKETSAQLTWAWNWLDSSLCESILRPTSHATVSAFIEMLKDMKEVWFDKYSQHIETRPPPSPQSIHHQNNEYTNNQTFRPYRQSQGQYQPPYSPRQFVPNNQNFVLTN